MRLLDARLSWPRLARLLSAPAMAQRMRELHRLATFDQAARRSSMPTCGRHAAHAAGSASRRRRGSMMTSATWRRRPHDVALRQARFDADTRRTRSPASRTPGQLSSPRSSRKLDREIALSRRSRRPRRQSRGSMRPGCGWASSGSCASDPGDRRPVRQSAIAIAGQLDSLNQRLALLQARVRLGSSTKRPSSMADPRARALRDFVVRTGRESVRLANEASERRTAFRGGQPAQAPARAAGR